LAIALEKVFSFRVDWHQQNCAKRLVQQYQTALDACLEGDDVRDCKLQACLTHCVHCGIRFVTDPRCAGRRDLRCPFGCRRHHRRQLANQRSRKYYQTDGGRQKKKQLNALRSRTAAASPADAALEPDAGLSSTSALPSISAAEPNSPPQPDSTDRPLPHELDVKVELQLDQVTLRRSSLAASPMLPYVRMIIHLIDGVWLELNELVDLLSQAMRQRSIAFRRRTDYVLAFLHQHPP
jgi:hypothetical protein